MKDGKCVFIEGSRLCSWLEESPSRLRSTEMDKIAAAIATIADEGGDGVTQSSKELSPA